MATIRINGNASEISAQVWVSGVFNRNLPLNSTETVSSGGFNPATEEYDPVDEVRVYCIKEGFEITGGLPETFFYPSIGNTLPAWENNGSYYYTTVRLGSNGGHTPTISEIIVLGTFNIDFSGELSRFTVEVRNSSGVVLQTLNNSLTSSISNTLIGENLVIIPTEDSQIEDVTSNVPFDFETETHFTFEVNELGEYVALLLERIFNDKSPPYIVTVDAIEKINTVSPFNQVFNISDSELLALGDIEIIDPVTPSINRSNYIINILALPFKLPADFLGSKTNIVLGSYNTSIESTTLISDSIEIDLGSMLVNGLGNSVDFVSTYELQFPFIENVIELNSFDVVGKTISFQYVLDVYTGDLTVNIYNSEKVEPIQSVKASIGRNIPYRLVNDIQDSLGGLNGVENYLKSVTLKITRPELVSGEFNNLVKLSGSIGSKKGYIRFAEVNLNLKASATVKNSIKSLLQNGVIIK